MVPLHSFITRFRCISILEKDDVTLQNAYFWTYSYNWWWSSLSSKIGQFKTGYGQNKRLGWALFGKRWICDRKFARWHNSGLDKLNNINDRQQYSRQERFKNNTGSIAPQAGIKKFAFNNFSWAAQYPARVACMCVPHWLLKLIITLSELECKL